MPEELRDRLVQGLAERLSQIGAGLADHPTLFAGSFGAAAGLIGAASLPLYRQFSPSAAMLTGRPARVA